MQSVSLPGLFPAGGRGLCRGHHFKRGDGSCVAEAVALTLCGLPVGDLEPRWPAMATSALGSGSAA